MGNKAGKATNNPPPPNNGEEDSSSMFSDSPGEKKPSYYQMAKDAYDSLVKAIIRPPRCDNYETRHLGPTQFPFCSKVYQRSDFELTNPRGMRIVCSHWEPLESHRPNAILPCVIYMHGNSSARLEALPVLAPVLSLGATLLAFDFCGSGKSEGEYVSLGAFEKDDLQAVIEHLRSTGTTSMIALWGRSMGAATSLLHGERDPSIAGMVLDSSFSDLSTLAEEMVERGRKHGLFAPGFVVAMAIRWIRSSVQQKAKFDIHDLSPIRHADKCFIPALFVAAEGDEFVPKHHSEKIHSVYAGDKTIIIVEGDHNSIRPQFAYDSITNFLQVRLFVPPEWIMEEGFQLPPGAQPWPSGVPRSSSRKTMGSSSSSGSGSGSGARGSGSGSSSSSSSSSSGKTQAAAGEGRAARTGLDEALSASAYRGASGKGGGKGSDEGQMDVGMTRDMQQDVQSRLFGVFGGVRGGGGGGGGGVDRGRSQGEEGDGWAWPCPVCTLINAGEDDLCVACDNPRE